MITITCLILAIPAAPALADGPATKDPPEVDGGMPVVGLAVVGLAVVGLDA